MLHINDIKDNSIIELFCKPFDKLTKTTNNQVHIKFIFSLLYMDFGKYNEFLDETDFHDEFSYKVILARAELIELEVDDKTLIFFCVLCEGNLGKIVMYVTYLKYMSNLLGIKFMSLKDICDMIFPLGFPTDDDMINLWDSLKYNSENGSSYNLLDNENALKFLIKNI